MEPTGWLEVAANLQLLVAGGTFYLAVLNCATWYRLREDRSLFWLGMWALSLTGLILANFAVFTVGADGVFDVVITLRSLAVSVAAVLALPFAASFTKRRMPRELIVALAAFMAVRLVLWLTTDLVYEGFAGGTPRYGPLAGPLVIPVALTWVGYLLWTVARQREPDVTDRSIVFVGLAATGAFLFASLLFAEGPVSELLTGYYAVPVALALQLVVLRRLAALDEAHRRQAEWQAGVAEIGGKALLPVEPEDLLAEAVAIACRLLDADSCDAFLGPAGRSVAHAGLDRDRPWPPPVGRLTAPIGLPAEELGWLVAERARPFGDDDRALLEGVAFVVAASLRRRKAEDEIRHRALHDDLTGLPNRVLLRDRLSTALERAARTGSTVAVIFCDLDRFKFVNDVHGHAVGDELLLVAAHRLQSAVRAGDTVCRFGGDEFVVVCEDLSQEDTLEIAERMQAALAQPVTIDTIQLDLLASIGIATSITTDDPDALLRDADTAMYRAKERGGGQIEVYEESLRAQLLRRLETEQQLAEAADRHEIVLHYQPIIDLETESVPRVEALARWRRDGDRLILPDDWIPLAEQTGRILEIGRVVLRDACREAGSWAKPSSLGVCVNISPLQLADTAFVDDVVAALSDRLDPGRLCLEITEQAMMRNGAASISLLRRVRELGVSVALDDFGSGYSSLNLLAGIPLDAIKIDRTFVAEIGDPHVRLLVSGILALARSLGLEVVAEGVERPDQAAILRDLGCRYAQGFLLGRPQPAPQVRALLGLSG